jgi:putative thioredoxin
VILEEASQNGAGDERIAEVLRHLDAIPQNGPLGQEAKQLRAQATFVTAPAEQAESLQARLTADPGNLGAHYELGRVAVRQQHYDEAARHFLKIIERDPTFQKGVAREAMLALITILGPDDPRAAAYRRKLSSLLFA